MPYHLCCKSNMFDFWAKLLKCLVTEKDARQLQRSFDLFVNEKVVQPSSRVDLDQTLSLPNAHVVNRFCAKLRWPSKNF